MLDTAERRKPAIGWIHRHLLPENAVARALTWTTVSASVSRGIFFSISAVFFTRVAGLAPTTVGLGLTVAGGVGVGGAFLAGYLARKAGARRVLLATTAGQSLALVCYLNVRTPATFIVVACAALGLQAMQRTGVRTMIAESFTGPDRVEVAARLRVVTNVSIGVGSALAAVALAIDTRPAYSVAMLATGALLLISALPLQRLRGQTEPGAANDSGIVDRRRSPLLDRTYLAASGLYAVMAMQFGLLTVGVPLWVAGWTKAPAATVAALLALNTIIVSLLQVRAARRTNDLNVAGRAVASAGALLALACALYAGAAHGPLAAVLALLVLATVSHSLAEILSEAGGWTLAFELADQANAGAYQGVSQTGAALGSMLAPLVVTATAIEHGGAGWAVLAAIFLIAGFSTLRLVRGHTRRTAVA